MHTVSDQTMCLLFIPGFDQKLLLTGLLARNVIAI